MTLHYNWMNNSFLKVSCNVDPKNISMKLLCSIGLPYTLNRSFIHARFYNIMSMWSIFYKPLWWANRYLEQNRNLRNIPTHTYSTGLQESLRQSMKKKKVFQQIKLEQPENHVVKMILNPTYYTQIINLRYNN